MAGPNLHLWSHNQMPCWGTRPLVRLKVSSLQWKERQPHSLDMTSTLVTLPLGLVFLKIQSPVRLNGTELKIIIKVHLDVLHFQNVKAMLLQIMTKIQKYNTYFLKGLLIQYLLVTGLRNSGKRKCWVRHPFLYLLSYTVHIQNIILSTRYEYVHRY